MTTSETEPTAAATGARTHVNEVELVGELSGEVDVRELPSGDVVASFRLTVRTAAPRRSRGTPPPAARADSIDCAVWRPALRTRLAACRIGDELAVAGSLRHRYWRGPGGLASRYEVEVGSIRVLRRSSP